ncbi:Hypothetical predicted protein [Olea europaea subsp. europaea]|uniref:Uncharacterized protein n=1 Tax=Olea europaea subsp. europaea TaxID=158383 RepID=A0A8S0SYS0_OLEEU|nr:Hypothetical predicted protein [Olea europaea subsp. europaea]
MVFEGVIRLVSIVQDSTEATGETTRRRPLQICGASILATAHIVCTKAQDSDSPIGSMAKRITPLAKRITPLINSALPLIYAMQYQWLVSLSFIDDRILAIENILELIFPPSKRLFNKIDDLVYTAECLPEKFDNVLNSFPVLIHRFPLLDWVMLRLISWLTFLINMLTHWGSKDNTREKEITIDMNRSKSESTDCYLVDYSQEPSNAVQTEDVKRLLLIADTSEQRNKTVEEANCPDESPCTSSFESATSSPLSVLSQDEAKSADEKGKSNNLKCSYKEILEKGLNENTENKEIDALKEFGWEKDAKKKLGRKHT